MLNKLNLKIKEKEIKKKKTKFEALGANGGDRTTSRAFGVVRPPPNGKIEVDEITTRALRVELEF